MEKENVPEVKPKKKKGKIARVYGMHKKGASNKEIAQKMNISERVVSSYIWRAANPEKYKELLNRYFAKKREKQENEKIKLAVNNAKTSNKKKED